MLTVSYFCTATELRFLNDTNNEPTNDEYSKEKSEYWHFKAVEFSCLYLPGTCPIIKHYINSYTKHYVSTLEKIVNLFSKYISLKMK